MSGRARRFAMVYALSMTAVLDQLLRAEAVLIACGAEDGGLPPRWGDASLVLAAGDDHLRKEGVAIVWGPDTIDTAQRMLAVPDPIVLVAAVGGLGASSPVLRAAMRMGGGGQRVYGAELIEGAAVEFYVTNDAKVSFGHIPQRARRGIARPRIFPEAPTRRRRRVE